MNDIKDIEAILHDYRSHFPPSALLSAYDGTAEKEATQRLHSLIEKAQLEELRSFADWLNKGGIDVQTGKDNVDYYLEETKGDS